MSSRRAWCQSRLNSSCSRASSSVRLNISLRRWTPRAGLHRPVGTAVVHAVHGSKALLVNQGERLVSENLGPTSLQALSLLRAVTRNWDCQRLSCGSRIRNILPSLGQAQRPRPFITLSPPCPRLARGFYEQIKVESEIEMDMLGTCEHPPDVEVEELDYLGTRVGGTSRSRRKSFRIRCMGRARKRRPRGAESAGKQGRRPRFSRRRRSRQRGDGDGDGMVCEQ